MHTKSCSVVAGPHSNPFLDTTVCNETLPCHDLPLINDCVLIEPESKQTELGPQLG